MIPEQGDMPAENPPLPVAASRVFNIYENDVAELERILPELMDRMGMLLNDTRTRVLWTKVRGIVANVRWNYGPPTSVQEPTP